MDKRYSEEEKDTREELKKEIKREIKKQNRKLKIKIPLKARRPNLGLKISGSWRHRRQIAQK